MADTTPVDAASKAEAVLGELQRAIETDQKLPVRSPEDQIDKGVAIRRVRPLLRDFLNSAEHSQEQAKKLTPTIEPESLKSRDERIKEIKEAAGL